MWIARAHVFDTAHPTAAGHFPGNAIIPGAVLLDEILRGVALDGFSPREIRSAKFLKPVRPGDRLVIRWTLARKGELKVEAEVDGEVAVTATLGLSDKTGLAEKGQTS